MFIFPVGFSSHFIPVKNRKLFIQIKNLVLNLSNVFYMYNNILVLNNCNVRKIAKENALKFVDFWIYDCFR